MDSILWSIQIVVGTTSIKFLVQTIEEQPLKRPPANRLEVSGSSLIWPDLIIEFSLIRAIYDINYEPSVISVCL